MGPVWEAAAIAGWAVVLLNLLLTLRLVRWLRSFQAAQRLDDTRGDLPELPLGEPPPAFRAKRPSRLAFRFLVECQWL